MIILKEKDTSHILWKDLFSSCSGMNSYHCYPNGPRSISNCHLKIRVICLKTFKKSKTFQRNSTILLLIIIQGTRFSGKKFMCFKFFLQNTIDNTTKTSWRGDVTRRVFLWVNSVLKSLPNGFPHKQSVPLQWWRRSISNKFHQGKLTNIFLMIFAGITLKLEKVGTTFWSFNPCPSLLSLVTDNRKQFQRLNKIWLNKTGPTFWKFNWCEDKFWFFKKIANSKIQPLYESHNE